MVAGERRYRAAQIVGLETVPAQVKEMSDAEALQCALTENIQREDLNPIEETEAILRLLELSLDRDKESVISLLNRIANRKRGITDTDVRKQDEDAIASVFATLGKDSPESFRTHRLPLLNLPPEILDAVRQQKMKPKTAREIAKIQDIELRGKIFQEAIDYSLSFNDVKERINAEKQLTKRDELQTRLDAIPKKTRKTKLWDDPAKLSRLEALLADLEQLLSE
ncbi:ParB/RepB/Spo0J family partition protein [Limnospira platensis]|uniref:ParB/RepB/Spo0J family partition protein n=1 Tax=Limnospira platensis TaxID=118562 RepID=UPI0021AA373B|nr:chromosome partitioning protein, ParB family [Arthrospira platensis C1]